MDPAAAPFASTVAQWGAVGVLVAVLAFAAWQFWKEVRELRAKLMDIVTEQIKADRDAAAAFNALRDVVRAALGGKP
jgi:hypothetical protein